MNFQLPFFFQFLLNFLNFFSISFQILSISFNFFSISLNFFQFLIILLISFQFLLNFLYFFNFFQFLSISSQFIRISFNCLSISLFLCLEHARRGEPRGAFPDQSTRLTSGHGPLGWSLMFLRSPTLMAPKGTPGGGLVEGVGHFWCSKTVYGPEHYGLKWPPKHLPQHPKPTRGRRFPILSTILLSFCV